LLHTRRHNDTTGADVDPDSKLWHIRLRARLTTIKLALQLLKRQSRSGRDPGELADTALQAVDALTRELEEREATPR
jgi:hypothetical protein